MSSEGFLLDLKDLLSLEKNMVLLYSELSLRANDSKIKKVAQKIHKQEIKHSKLISAIIEKSNH